MNEEAEGLLDRVRAQMRDVSLLDRALTHPSADASVDGNYERLEFLGDAVLGLVIVEHIYRTFPHVKEGPLARLKARLGSAEVLREVGEEHGIIEAARFGQMPVEQFHRARNSACADMVESVIGAVYLDRGLEAARVLIVALLGSRLQDATLQDTGARDAKSTLHELVQGALHTRPSYHLIDEVGPSHARQFLVEVRIQDRPCGQSWGHRRKSAEQGAAKLALRAVKKGEIDLAKMNAPRQ